MDASYQPDPVVFLSVLLAERLVFGFLFAAHGTQKLFGWFRGTGLDNTGGFFEQLGFRPGRGFAAAAGLTELTAGLLIALGFLGPVGPALLLSVMVVAVITVNWRNGLLATSNGSELLLLYITAAISLAFVGFGRYSLDAALGLRIGRPGSSGRYWLGARSLDSRTCSPRASACRLGRHSAVRRSPGSDMIPSFNVRLAEIVKD